MTIFYKNSRILSEICAVVTILVIFVEIATCRKVSLDDPSSLEAKKSWESLATEATTSSTGEHSQNGIATSDISGRFPDKLRDLTNRTRSDSEELITNNKGKQGIWRPGILATLGQSVNNFQRRNATSSSTLKMMVNMIETMGCFPKFFCALTIQMREPDEDPSVLQELFYLLRTVLVNDSGEEEEDDEPSAFEDILSGEDSDEGFIFNRLKRLRNQLPSSDVQLDVSPPGIFKLFLKVVKDRLWQKYIESTRGRSESGSSRSFQDKFIQAKKSRRLRNLARSIDLGRQIGEESETMERCDEVFRVCPYTTNNLLALRGTTGANLFKQWSSVINQDKPEAESIEVQNLTIANPSLIGSTGDFSVTNQLQLPSPSFSWTIDNPQITIPISKGTNKTVEEEQSDYSGSYESESEESAEDDSSTSQEYGESYDSAQSDSSYELESLSSEEDSGSSEEYISREPSSHRPRPPYVANRNTVTNLFNTVSGNTEPKISYHSTEVATETSENEILPQNTDNSFENRSDKEARGAGSVSTETKSEEITQRVIKPSGKVLHPSEVKTSPLVFKLYRRLPLFKYHSNIQPRFPRMNWFSLFRH